MTKKIVATIITLLATLLVFAGCSKDNPTDTPTDNTTNNTSTESISFNAEELILAYCNGTWDGKFISDAEHCASIEDGILWIDCQSSGRIVDMGPYEDETFYNSVIGESQDGTWVHNDDANIVELWCKGFRKEVFPLHTECDYSTSVYPVEGGFAVHCGSSLTVVDHHGYGRTNLIFHDVIDVVETDGGIWFSTFTHQNYLITGFDDEAQELDTSYVRYPDVPGEIVHSNDIRLTQAFNLFYGEGWDGACRRLDSGEFMAVDYYGNIVVNNEIIGNVCLGDSVVDSDGPNIYLDVDRSYYLDGKQLVYFEHGPIEKKVDVPDGTPKFLRIEDLYEDDAFVSTIIAAQSGNTVYIVKDGTVKVISEDVVDASVAYDTLYYMVGDVVYSLDWLNPEATPEVYFEGAYAVSHHTDEAEGAIVPQKRANYDAYGYTNLYSPYGS